MAMAGALPMIMTAISTAMSVMSALKQGAQASDAAEETRQDAKFEQSAAQIQAGKIRKAVGSQQSQAKAQLAASGVDINTGTAETINTDIAYRGEQDALTAILDGDNQSARLRRQANQQESSGKAGLINAGSSILAGGYNIAKGWKTSAPIPGSSQASIY